MNDGTESRVERKRHEARGRILAVARELFGVEGGFESATIREIAGRADVSVGAVYLHFKTKVDILAALVSECVGDIITSAEEALALARTGREKFDALVDGFGRWSLDTEMRLFAQLLFRQGHGALLELPEESLPRDLSRFIGLIAETLEFGNSDGSFAIAEDLHLVAAIIFQWFYGMAVFDIFSDYTGIDTSSTFSSTEITKPFKRLLLRSLGNDCRDKEG